MLACPCCRLGLLENDVDCHNRSRLWAAPLERARGKVQPPSPGSASASTKRKRTAAVAFDVAFLDGSEEEPDADVTHRLSLRMETRKRVRGMTTSKTMALTSLGIEGADDDGFASAATLKTLLSKADDSLVL